MPEEVIRAKRKVVVVMPAYNAAKTIERSFREVCEQNVADVVVIVELVLRNYRVDPSQGTHFFQNLTSFGVGYFTIDTNRPGEGGLFRKEILDQMPAVEETALVRHVRFDRPLRIMMDGKKQVGAVLLPENEVVETNDQP